MCLYSTLALPAAAAAMRSLVVLIPYGNTYFGHITLHAGSDVPWLWSVNRILLNFGPFNYQI